MAQAMQEAGYNEATSEVYSNDNAKGEWRMYHKAGKWYNALPAPTLYEATKWLRSMGYYAAAQPHPLPNSGQLLFYATIDLVEDNRFADRLTDIQHQTYEQALAAGILVAVRSIINKNQKR